MNVFIKSNAPLYLPPGKTMKTSHFLDLVQTRIYCLLLKHYYHFQKFQSISWKDNYTHTCCSYCWQFLLEWIQYGIFVRIYVSTIFKALTSQLQNSKDLTIYLFLYNFGNRLKKLSNISRYYTLSFYPPIYTSAFDTIVSQRFISDNSSVHVDVY